MQSVLAAAALLVAAAPLAAQRTLTPRDAARIRTVIDAKVSPGGENVAYLLHTPRKLFQKDDGPAWVELQIVNREGESRPYVTGEVEASDIAWIPGGEGVSFLAKRGDDEHTSLYYIPLDGGEARRILAHDTDIGDYRWDPRGGRVAFTAKPAKDKEQEKLEEQGFNQEIFEEDWRPVKVWTAELDLTPAQQDEEAPEPRPLDLDGSVSALEWAAGGDRLAVALSPTPLVDDLFMNRRVEIVDAQSGETLGRLKPPGKMGDFAWSPDGERLALISTAGRTDPSAGRLTVGPAAGGELKDLIPGLKGHVSAVAWRDEETILYLADIGVAAEFGSVRRDGSGRDILIPASEGRVLLDFSVDRESGAAAFLEQSPSHPTEVSFLAADRNEPKRLTDSNPWLEDIQLAPQEVVSYEARDGLELEGILIRPLNEESGELYPLLLAVHGGPEAHVRNGWLTRYADPGQAAAARGFAVFYPNYRGSTGRGVEFSKLGHADMAGKEFDDLVDAADHFIETGLADPERIGITGGSYGGYASAWGATYYSERFAASVMFVGISDDISKAGTTDIPEEMFWVHHRMRVWDDWELFLERSPIYHAGESGTPTLILHGKEDPRVHPSQSLELYRHLKIRSDAPVRLVLYPGEGHGNRRAASRYDYNLRMLRWFEHFLQGPGDEAPPYELNYGRREKDEQEDEPESGGS